MGCNTDNKQIGEHEYSVTQWPATKALLNKLKLIKTFGSAMANIASLISSDKSEENKDAEALAKGLSDLFDNNSPEDIVEIIKDFIIGVACDGTRITPSKFEELFSGDDLLEAYKVFIFVIQVNYKNLMKGPLADRLMEKIKANK